MTDSIQRKSLRYNGMYRGLVVDTADPYQLGRIRVKAFPMFVGIETEQLPWATPAMPLFTGAGPGFSAFAVPHLQTFVFIFFENGDPYQPVYFAEAQTGTHGLPLFAYDGYPFSKVLQSKEGIICQILDKDGEEKVLVIHPKGSYFYMDKDGNVTMYAYKAANVVAETDNVNVVSMAKDVNIGAKKNVNIVAEDVDVNVGAKKKVTIVATEDDITITAAAKNVTINAKENCTINADKNVNVNAKEDCVIKATQDCDITAVNVNVHASGDANVNGASVSITGSGTVEISGNPVQIN